MFILDLSFFLFEFIFDFVALFVFAFEFQLLFLEFFVEFLQDLTSLCFLGLFLVQQFNVQLVFQVVLQLAKFNLLLTFFVEFVVLELL